MRYFRKLEGSLCYLSPINPEDAERYTRWLNDIEVVANLTLLSSLITLSGEREILEKLSQEYVFAIVDRETDEPIGSCGLKNLDFINRTCEVGIFIGEKDYWGRGYGTEAMRLLLDFAFGILGLENVMLEVYEYNRRAISSYKKCGFKEIGRRRKAKFIAGERYDIILMDILRDEYKSIIIKKLIEYIKE